MSVEYTEGDLLDWPAGITVIAHVANSLGLAGAGIARQIAGRYPESAKSYRQWCETALGGRADLGTFHVTPVENGTKRIAWLVGQADVGTDRRQLNYEALYAGLESLKTLLTDAHAQGRTQWVLGLPQWLGCGLAGGREPIVQAMVETLFYQSPVKCVVVEKRGGRQ